VSVRTADPSVVFNFAAANFALSDEKLCSLRARLQQI
jgi:hypothetical protein